MYFLAGFLSKATLVTIKKLFKVISDKKFCHTYDFWS